jgi:hypothetical protein
MQRNKLIWILVIFLATTTIAITVDKSSANNSEKPEISPESTPPVPTVTEFLSKYGVVDYAGVDSLLPSEQQKRQRISRRYDRQGWVQANPHPETGMVGRVSDEKRPPAIPVEESDLVITGRVETVATYLSTDKKGVYSEFKIQVGTVLKTNASTNTEKLGEFVTADRAGGSVRYPNNHVVLYLDSMEGLPEVGKEYVLFLKDDQDSENFLILTGYEMQESKTVPLDPWRPVDDIKKQGKLDFLKTVREKVSRVNTDRENWGKP